ncbi:unnamed protein product, partial [Effrenium voratum]
QILRPSLDPPGVGRAHLKMPVVPKMPVLLGHKATDMQKTGILAMTVDLGQWQASRMTGQLNQATHMQKAHLGQWQASRMTGQLNQATHMQKVHLGQWQASRMTGQLNQATHMQKAHLGQWQASRMTGKLNQATHMQKAHLGQWQASRMTGKLNQATHMQKARNYGQRQLEAQIQQLAVDVHKALADELALFSAHLETIRGLYTIAEAPASATAG